MKTELSYDELSPRYSNSKIPKIGLPKNRLLVCSVNKLKNNIGLCFKFFWLLMSELEHFENSPFLNNLNRLFESYSNVPVFWSSGKILHIQFKQSQVRTSYNYIKFVQKIFSLWRDVITVSWKCCVIPYPLYGRDACTCCVVGRFDKLVAYPW